MESKKVIHMLKRVNVFKNNSKPGICQYLHIFDDKESLLSEFEKSRVKDEFDHSYICRDSDESIFILWKNKAGEIQLCGSGAFASSWYYLKNNDISKLKINCKNIQLTAIEQYNQTCLLMPSLISRFCKNTFFGSLFVNEASGIYLMDLKDKDTLNRDDWVEYICNEDKPVNIHGFCVFSWEPKSNLGTLRYFTPWHGRNEDYVTGSIHQYLNPLISKRYNKPHVQTWFQHSLFSGVVKTTSFENGVVLTGSAQIL